MTGSHRAPRGGSRAAARAERRRQARRRYQLLGAGAAVLVLLGGGGIAIVNIFGGDDSPGGAKSGAPDDKPSESDSKLLSDAKALIDGPAAKPLTETGSWAIASTADGSSAPERSFVCQAQRFADPAGIRTWVRTFRNPTTKDTAVQYVEVSNDAAAAGKAYTTITGWLSQCNTPQLRLVASYTAEGLGDRGVVAVFGQPVNQSASKYRTISVTTSGQTTMVVEHASTGGSAPKPDGVLSTASAGLKRICAEIGGNCRTTPTAKPGLLPTSEAPGFMAPIDLPVLTSVDKPWVSVASGPRSGTGCEKIDLKKAKATKYKAQTYVVPEANVPTEFGLDTTVAEFGSAALANTFVTGIRKNVDTCKKTTSNATVKSTGQIALSTIKGETWRVAYDTGGGKVFTYRIGIALKGNRSIYVAYPVLKNLDITDSAFNEILGRASERSDTFK